LKKFKLSDVADIKLSNVDKKSKSEETPVTLANYVDVYKNWYISNDMMPTFMEATATAKEIEKFKLKKGQVAITKDSEKADDIGRATYIKDDFENTLLGYHTVLITPDEEMLNGSYLNYYFQTQNLRKYFEYNVSGSGQRVTLQLDSIKNIPLFLPDIVEQKNISKILDDIIDKIALNRKINTELEQMAREIYDYWFLQFDFPDENGQPYRSSGGRMVYNAQLKREIPEGWEVKKLGEVAEMYQPQIISAKEFSEEGKFLVYGANGIIGKYSKYNHEHQEFIITVRGNTSGNLHFTMKKSWITGNSMIVRPNADEVLTREFLYYYFLSTQSAMKVVSGSAQPQITRANLETINIIIPPRAVLNQFGKIIKSVFQKIQTNNQESRELANLRDWVLPMLMNGQIQVKD
jgi:type I restriction enzyme S subunit